MLFALLTSRALRDEEQNTGTVIAPMP